MPYYFITKCQLPVEATKSASYNYEWNTGKANTLLELNKEKYSDR